MRQHDSTWRLVAGNYISSATSVYYVDFIMDSMILYTLLSFLGTVKTCWLLLWSVSVNVDNIGLLCTVKAFKYFVLRSFSLALFKSWNRCLFQGQFRLFHG